MTRKRNEKRMDIDILKSSRQIKEKKQDIKYDTRDYAIEYLKQKFEDGNLYVPLDIKEILFGMNLINVFLLNRF